MSHACPRSLISCSVPNPRIIGCRRLRTCWCRSASALPCTTKNCTTVCVTSCITDESFGRHTSDGVFSLLQHLCRSASLKNTRLIRRHSGVRRPCGRCLPLPLWPCRKMFVHRKTLVFFFSFGRCALLYLTRIHFAESCGSDIAVRCNCCHPTRETGLSLSLCWFPLPPVSQILLDPMTRQQFTQTQSVDVDASMPMAGSSMLFNRCASPFSMCLSQSLIFFCRPTLH